MSAKEKLRKQVKALSEEEASQALALLELRSDPVIAAFRDAPADDEPESEKEKLERRLGTALRKMDIGKEGNVERDDILREMMATRSHTWAQLRELTGLSDGRLNQIRYRSR